MFCRFCGANIPEDSLFCSKCGRSLGQREQPQIESPIQREQPQIERPVQREHPQIERPVQREHSRIESLGLSEEPRIENFGQREQPQIERLGLSEETRIDRLVKTLRLNTPYPYAGILILLLVIWVNYPRKSTYDYSPIKWSIEMDHQLDVPDDKLYRESLSLVVENTGTKAIKGLPIEIHARIEPQKTAEVVAAFPGDRETVIAGGKPQPVALVLGDSILPGAKRRYAFDETVRAKPPFKVTLEIRENDARTILTHYVLER
jgi:hypothetical protein